MKILRFLLLISCLSVSLKVFSQQSLTVTLSVKNMPLTAVLTEIEKQTGITFFYKKNVLASVGKISIQADKASLNSVLNKCFQNTSIMYSFTADNLIVLTDKNEKKNADGTLAIDADFFRVQGLVYNIQNESLSGASVIIKRSRRGTTTNVKGEFGLENIKVNDILVVSFIGYKPVEIGIQKIGDNYRAYPMEKSQAENLRSETGKDVVFTLHLIADVGTLAETMVRGEVPKQIGTVVDLKHRSHLNLGQVLEGTVPGLTLKSSTTTSQELSVNGAGFNGDAPLGIFTGIDQLKIFYEKFMAQSPQYKPYFPTFDVFYRVLYANTGNSTFKLLTATINSGLIPELRGSSSFAGNTSGMLVVIDGVEQNSFPSNYPMNNVAKIEIVKDPAELIKWGAKAIGGLILITTNGAKAGKLQFNYNSNLYYSARPDISNAKLQLASTADILAYYKEQVDRGFASYIGADNPVGLKPAQLLLYNLKKNGLSYDEPKFVASWDSLARLSNRDQLRMLYQNSFTQNHSLNVSGGTRAYRFTLGGIYSNSLGASIGSKATNLNLNLQNIFSLLKNKLRITWQLNSSTGNNRNSIAGDGSNLDPYQLLVDPYAKYVYDYSGLVSEDVNKAMLSHGYLNYGVNPLEDARNTKNISKTFGINSRLNMDWNLAKGLQWSTAFVYNRGTGSGRNLQGIATSQVRQLRDDYGSLDSIGRVKFYVPSGAILNTSSSKSMDWNLRSGLSYNHRFDARNVLNATFGAAAGSTENSTLPNANTYGYDPDTQIGQPILAAPASGIINYLGTTQYPSQLLVRGLNTASYNRNLALNGSLTYTYDNRYILSMQYGAVYTPNAGFIPSYSDTKNYAATASWLINKEHFFKVPLVSTLKLSAITGKIQLGKVPGQLSTNPIAQPLWNNTALFVSGYTPSQLNGQGISNIGGALEAGLGEDRIQFHLSYNHSSDGSHQINGQVAYEISREPWFNSSFISKLIIDASLQDFNALQAQAIVMGTNAPNPGGGFSIAAVNNFNTLPPATVNKELHLGLGLFKDRMTFDLRYYHKVITSSSGSGLLPPDPSTGLNSQISNSRLLNKGLELYLRGKVIEGKDFMYSITLNGAYNLNRALDVPDIPFAQYPSYLTSPRAGYATDALWSYRWAGLDNMGNPQVYKDKDTKVPVFMRTDDNGNLLTPILDLSSLVYSGRTRAPWSGGLIQEWQYKNFFASARLVFNLGYVMRTYIPVAGPFLDKNILIGQRWQKPGDEAYTDIAAMSQTDATRSLVIQNSSNSIVSADHIRLREVQLGYEVPASVLKKGLIKGLTISAQIENVALLWTRNKLGVDPEAISSNGTVGIPQPRQYVLTINMSF